MRRTLAAALTVTLVLGGVAYAGKFKSTWKAPGIEPADYSGKKIVALVMTDDQNLEVSSEEALAGELTARGVQGVAAYRLIPREELRDKDKARGWFERAAVAGVVAMRVVSSEKEVSYTPDMWATPYYGSLWGYYGYGWSSVVVAGSWQEDRVITVETLIFRLPDGKLVWASVSEKTNPKGAGSLIKQLVDDTAKEMRKQGMVMRGSAQ
ncbi:MAG: hypothetical protein NTY02_04350 [Acidobacteria bacterium]|nr:hypothetical protein [Acidobacteriota bacterium]